MATMKNSIYELCRDKQEDILLLNSVELMIKFGGVEIPDAVMAVPLHKHRQSGRPKAHKGWWSRE